MKVYTVFFVLIILILPIIAFGQVNPSDIWQNPDTDDFAEIQRRVEAYYEGRDKGKGSGYKQWKRWEYKMEHRLTPDGKITNYTAINFREFHRYKQNYEQKNGGASIFSSNGDWSFLAPASFSALNLVANRGGLGRVNVIAFPVGSTTTIYAGTPSGGLWRTTNGGFSWTNLTDGMPSIGVSGIAIDYTNSNIIYILTGDGDAGDTRSIGVLKTTNGGVTWFSTGLSYPSGIGSGLGYKLIMRPPPFHLELLAAMADGLHRTTDGGETWLEVQNGPFRDIELKPGDSEIVYAVTTNTFFRSTDGGASWNSVDTGLPTGENRVAIGVSPANPNYVYYLAGPGGSSGAGTFNGIYRSTDSGQSFTLRSSTPNLLGRNINGNDSHDQSWYNLSIAVSPINPFRVFTGAIDIWKSENGGSSFSINAHWLDSQPPEFVHADIHELVFNPANNALYCGSDGGVFRSADQGLSWQDITDGIGNMQYYRIAGYEPNPNLLIGGTQDNGSNKWTGGSSVGIFQSGDGGYCIIDHNNPDTFYHTVQYGKIYKSTDGGLTSPAITPQENGMPVTGAFITPIVMDPVNSNIIYAGYDDVWKSTDGGSSWMNMGGIGLELREMAIGAGRVYAASVNRLFMSPDEGQTWEEIGSGFPFGVSITNIAVVQGSGILAPTRVYITFGGFSVGEKVYMSNYDGQNWNWTNITESLPNCIVNCIAYEDRGILEDGGLYIGTDIGIFYRGDNMNDWIPFTNGLPSVPVYDLEINEDADLIRAATHGRGLWSSSTYLACPLEHILTQSNDPSNPNHTGFQRYEAFNDIESSRIITGGVGTDVTYQAGVSVTLLDGFHARAGNEFKAINGPCLLLSKTSGNANPINGVFVGEF